MANPLDTLTIEGFKSLRSLKQFELKAMNVLIGSNGAGKSNFISFFRFLRDIVDERLQLAVQRGGGADAFLFMGPKITQAISVQTRFGMNGYDFKLVPTVDGRLVFAEESTYYNGPFGVHRSKIGSGNVEAKLPQLRDDPGVNSPHGIPYYVLDSVSSWTVYHFHDTSENAAVRRFGNITDSDLLRPDAGNLAAFLYRIRTTHPDCYAKLISVIRLAAPYFADFRLRPNPQNHEMIQLEWFQAESDVPFLPSQLSDGTLRFICLATALLQPSPPSTMLFDEPELGLHPLALQLLGRLFAGVGKDIWGTPRVQVILSTQSAPLLNEFAPEDIVVVDRFEGESIFKRLRSEDLAVWLGNYSLADLWQKNIFGGRPKSEPSLVSAGARAS